MICGNPLTIVTGMLETSKQFLLGGQQCSRISGPEKLLKIVNTEINKETNEID